MFRINRYSELGRLKRRVYISGTGMNDRRCQPLGVEYVGNEWTFRFLTIYYTFGVFQPMTPLNCRVPTQGSE